MVCVFSTQRSPIHSTIFRERASRALVIVLKSRQLLWLQDAFKTRGFAASELVSTKTCKSCGKNCDCRFLGCLILRRGLFWIGKRGSLEKGSFQNMSCRDSGEFPECGKQMRIDNHCLAIIENVENWRGPFCCILVCFLAPSCILLYSAGAFKAIAAPEALFKLLACMHTTLRSSCATAALKTPKNWHAAKVGLWSLDSPGK